MARINFLIPDNINQALTEYQNAWRARYKEYKNKDLILIKLCEVGLMEFKRQSDIMLKESKPPE